MLSVPFLLILLIIRKGDIPLTFSFSAASCARRARTSIKTTQGIDLPRYATIEKQLAWRQGNFEHTKRAEVLRRREGVAACFNIV